MKYKRNHRLNKFGAWCAVRRLGTDAVGEALGVSAGHAWKLMQFDMVNAKRDTLRRIEEFTAGEITPTAFYEEAPDDKRQGELAA